MKQQSTGLSVPFAASIRTGTTFSPLPVPWEMLPPELQAYTGTGPEGKAEVTIKTVE